MYQGNGPKRITASEKDKKDREKIYDNEPFNIYDNEILRFNDDLFDSLNISLPSNNDNETNSSLSFDQVLSEDRSLLNVACANARSLVDKIKSLITLFEENQLHIAILTETWLGNKHCPPRVMNDLTIGANLSFIRRDRGSRGGGLFVCLLFVWKGAPLVKAKGGVPLYGVLFSHPSDMALHQSLTC